MTATETWTRVCTLVELEVERGAAALRRAAAARPNPAAKEPDDA